MQNLVERAEQSLAAYHRGHGIDRQPTDPSEPDALDVLGGRKSLIVPKSNNSSPSNVSEGSVTRPNNQPSPVAPAPMPSQAGAVQLLNEYYRSENDHKHEVYNYFSPQLEQSFPPQMPPPNPQPMVQPEYPTHPNTFAPYPANSSPLTSPTSPSTLSRAAVAAMDTYSVSSDATYSPQFEVPSAYSSHSMNNGFARAVEANHSWQSSLGQYQPPSPAYADGSGIDLGYTLSSPTNANTQFQHAQSPQQFPQRDPMTGISQGDIWSNFAQDFRP